MNLTNRIREESLPEPVESIGTLRAQLKRLYQRIRRLADHPQETPSDRKARRALDRTLQKKRSLLRHIRGSD